MKKIILTITFITLLITGLGLSNLEASSDTSDHEALEAGKYHYILHWDSTVALYHEDTDTVLWEYYNKNYEWNYWYQYVDNDNNLYLFTEDNEQGKSVLLKFDTSMNITEIELDLSSFDNGYELNRRYYINTDSLIYYTWVVNKNNDDVPSYLSSFNLESGELISKVPYEDLNSRQVRMIYPVNKDTIGITFNLSGTFDDMIQLFDKELNQINGIWFGLTENNENDYVEFSELDYKKYRFSSDYYSYLSQDTMNEDLFYLSSRFYQENDNVRFEIISIDLNTMELNSKTKYEFTSDHELYDALEKTAQFGDSMPLSINHDEAVIPINKEGLSHIVLDINNDSELLINPDIYYETYEYADGITEYNDQYANQGEYQAPFFVQLSYDSHIRYINENNHLITLGGLNIPFDDNEWFGYSGISTFIVDETPLPIIEAPKHIIKNASYITSGSFFLDHSIAINVDGEHITEQLQIITNEYQGNASTEGEYIVELAIKDDEDNILVTHEMIIEVIENIHPLFIIDHDHWIVDMEHEMTQTHVMDTLKALEVVNTESHAYTELTNTYNDSFDEIGTYQLELELLSASGIDYHLDYLIEVVDGSQDLSEHSFNPITAAIENWKITLTITGILVIAVYIKKK